MKTDSGFWDRKRRAIGDRIDKEGVEHFLSWPEFVESCHMGYWEYSEKQYADLSPRMKVAIDATGKSGTYVQQAWYLQKWEAISDKKISDLKSIHEFGGGYGAMAVLCHVLGFVGKYTIQDFPEMHRIQKHYTSTRAVNIECVSEPSDAELYIALFSISEVAPDLRFIPKCDNYLIGYQDSWGDGSWDNASYFAEVRELRQGTMWCNLEMPYFPGHCVMVGT